MGRPGVAGAGTPVIFGPLHATLPTLSSLERSQDLSELLDRNSMSEDSTCMSAPSKEC